MNAKWIRRLWMGFGFFLCINQGFTVVLGTLTTGYARGADVFMPVDLFMYILLFAAPTRAFQSRHRGLITNLLILEVLLWLWTFTGEFVAIEYAEFRFMYVHWTRALLVFITVITKIGTRQDALSLIYGVLGGLAVNVLVAMYQWQIGPVVIPFMDIQNSWRASGLIGPPNAFGVYVTMSAGILVRLAIFTRFGGKYVWFWRLIAAFAILSLFASYVRAAWLAFLGALGLFYLIDVLRQRVNVQQGARFFAIAAVATVLMAAVYGDRIIGRFHDANESLAGDQAHSRLNMARDAIRIWKDHKILGVGLNNYRYHATDDLQGTRIVHNLYLLILSQQGVPGLVLFVFIHILIFISGIRAMNTRDPILYHIAAGGITGFVAMMVYHSAAPDYRIIPVLLNHNFLIAFLPAMLVVNENTEKLMTRRRLMKMLRYKKRLAQENKKLLPDIVSQPDEPSKVLSDAPVMAPTQIDDSPSWK